VAIETQMSMVNGELSKNQKKQITGSKLQETNDKKQITRIKYQDPNRKKQIPKITASKSQKDRKNKSRSTPS